MITLSQIIVKKAYLRENVHKKKVGPRIPKIKISRKFLFHPIDNLIPLIASPTSAIGYCSEPRYLLYSEILASGDTVWCDGTSV